MARLADINDAMILLLVMSVVLAVIGALELWFLRRRRAQRGNRAEAETALPDRAHNAILTAKAIADTLARGGVRSPEAEEHIREAEVASRERNYRVAIELTDRAKAVLRAAKLRQEQKGDLSKLDSIKPKTEAEEVTAKERLMKELPPNYLQSKFSMNLAHDEIASAKASGLDATAAEALLAQAQASFDAQDYDEALKHAVRARRSLDGAPSSEAQAPSPEARPPPPMAPPSSGRTCPSCRSPVASDDAFCRKCGTTMPKVLTCPTCGAPIAEGDAFCRKCGTRAPGTGNP